jgi:hypothetical protein
VTRNHRSGNGAPHGRHKRSQDARGQAEPTGRRLTRASLMWRPGSGGRFAVRSAPGIALGGRPLRGIRPPVWRIHILRPKAQTEALAGSIHPSRAGMTRCMTATATIRGAALGRRTPGHTARRFHVKHTRTPDRLAAASGFLPQTPRRGRSTSGDRRRTCLHPCPSRGWKSRPRRWQRRMIIGRWELRRPPGEGRCPRPAQTATPPSGPAATNPVRPAVRTPQALRQIPLHRWLNGSPTRKIGRYQGASARDPR